MARITQRLLPPFILKTETMLLKHEFRFHETELEWMDCLPVVATLVTGRHVIIDYMTEQQLTETYCMIQEAAQHGDGYGIDEFDSEKDFRHEIEGSDCFAIVSKDSGELLAGLILAVSKFYRGMSGVCDPFIIVKRTERKQKLGEFCMRKAIEFSKKLGYMGMYVDTFSNNVAVQRIIEKIGGFQRVGFLPLGGRLQTGQLVGSVIYYRDLSPEKPKKPEDT
uniref:N-acetyltransferase domain-containing protein n=1 Tax=Magallana gigas TaxID=29159 RepID=A0A8W8NER2_MAGGI